MDSINTMLWIHLKTGLVLNISFSNSWLYRSDSNSSLTRCTNLVDLAEYLQACWQDESPSYWW